MEDGDADLEVDLWPFRKAVPEPITRRRAGNDLHIPSDTLNVDVCFNLGTYRRRDEDVSSHIAIEIAFDGRVVEVCKNLETTGIVNAVEFELAQSTGSAMLTGTRAIRIDSHGRSRTQIDPQDFDFPDPHLPFFDHFVGFLADFLQYTLRAISAHPMR